MSGPAPGYGLWLRAVCALAGLGPVGREALAPRLHGAYRSGMTPADAAAGVGERLAGDGSGGRPVSGKAGGT